MLLFLALIVTLFRTDTGLSVLALPLAAVPASHPRTIRHLKPKKGKNSRTNAPTPLPTTSPLPAPTAEPTNMPTPAPTQAAPTLDPTAGPSSAPILTMAPTNPPVTAAPAVVPTPLADPTTSPTVLPTKAPVEQTTGILTRLPTDAPSESPTKRPSANPTKSPTNSPTRQQESPTPVAGVVSLRLIHAPTNSVLLDLVDGMVIDLEDLGVTASFNVQAIKRSEDVQSVLFVETGRNEGVEPFAFCGDNSGDYNVCASLGVGTNAVTVIPFPGGGQSGTPFPQVSVRFEILGTSIVPPTGSPTNLPTDDPSGPRWIEVDANADIEERHESCFVMVGRKAYLVGGRGFKPVDIYDPVTRMWTKGSEPPIQMHHMQCVAAQGKLWVMAAWTDWYPTEKNAQFVYVYDPASDSWSTRTAMPENRRRGGAAVVVSTDETKIYVSHGNRGGHETGNHATSLGYLDEYSIATDSWTALSNSAPNPRDHCGGALVNNRICVAGGRNGGEIGWPEVAPTDCYDLSTGTWSVESSIPQVRGGSSYGTTCDGNLMIAGGEGSGKAWDQVDVFDGISWATVGSLVRGRHGSGLAVDCVCNQIHIASGAAGQGGGPEIRSIETYFPNGVDEVCTA